MSRAKESMSSYDLILSSRSLLLWISDWKAWCLSLAVQVLAVLEERVQQMPVADLLQLVHRSPSLSSSSRTEVARRSIDGRDVVLQLVSHL